MGKYPLLGRRMVGACMGRNGRAMSKIYRSGKKKDFKDYVLSTEKCLIALNSVMSCEGAKGEHARRLLRYYSTYGEFTLDQKKSITGMVREGKDKKKKEYKLYGLSDGVNVKIGFSCNIKRRMTEIQSGCAVKLELIWTHYIGFSRSEAAKQEGKLHRFCKKYRKQGEWFALDCMAMVRQFDVKTAEQKRRLEEASENEILFAAMDKI